MTAGASTGSAAGGAVALSAGTSAAGTMGAVSILAGSSTGSGGGSIQLSAGDGGTNGDGGTIEMRAGTKGSAGFSDGAVNLLSGGGASASQVLLTTSTLSVDAANDFSVTAADDFTLTASGVDISSSLGGDVTIATAADLSAAAGDMTITGGTATSGSVSIIAGSGQGGAHGGDVVLTPGGVDGGGGTPGVIKLGSSSSEGFHGIITASIDISSLGFPASLAAGGSHEEPNVSTAESSGTFPLPGYSICSTKDLVMVHPTFSHSIVGQAISMNARVTAETGCMMTLELINLGSSPTTSHKTSGAMVTFMIIQRKHV